MELLLRIIGMRLEKVYAHRYPGYLAYGQVVGVFGDGLSVQFDLSDETVAPMFEVFVTRARVVESPRESAEWDKFELGDFVVASVFVLRRKEWVEVVEARARMTYQSVGQHGAEQRSGTMVEGSDEHNSVIVDSGVSLVSMRGAELSLDADTFPLVFQLRYEVAPSVLPHGDRIAVNQHRMPQ